MLFTKDLTQLLFVPANKEGTALLPNTTDTVPTGVFSHSTQLTSVSIGESCTTYTTHSGILYTKDMTTLVAAPAGYGDSVVIPEVTTAIGPSAFAGLTLTTLVSLGTLTSIDPSAFTADTKANATVALINDETYKTNETLWRQAGFTHFTTLPTPGDITNPDPSAPEATGLTYTLQDDYTLSVAWSGDADPDANLTIPDTATLNHVTYRVASIAPSAFSNRETLESVSIPSSITTISDSAFAGCINLSKATLPESITTLGVSAFENTSLTKVFLPTTTTSLGNRAFANCASLTHVIAQSVIPSIAEDVLDSCTNVSVLTPKQPDDTYLWMTGIPSSGNHIEPYEITLADTPTTLEVGQARDILKDATIATPKDTSLSYAYPATCVSVDNSGVVTAKAKGSADVLVSIMFDDYTLAEDSLTVTVEEPKATAKAASQPDDSIVPLGYAAPLATDTPVASGSGATFECAVGKTNLRCTLLSETTVSAAITSTTDTTLSFPNSVSYNGKTYTVAAIENLYSNWSPAQSLTSLTIPTSVESIGNSAFYSCSSLATLTFAPNSTLRSIGPSAFSGCKFTSLTIPASVESIGDYAFNNNPSLTALTFAPNSKLRSIGNGAFSSCKFTSLTIPASVESIGDLAFQSNPSLTTVTFEQGSTPATFGGRAFYGCTSLASFKLSGTGNAYKLDTGILMSGDGTRILQIPPTLKLPASYTIPEGIVEISGGAFVRQTNLTSLIIPASVESIGNFAFQECTSLTTVTFAPNSKLRSIGNSAFRDCKLTSLTIPAFVESIGSIAFAYCYSLATLTFADNSKLHSIGNDAFYNCKITSLTIPASVESIGRNAFYNCTSLTTVTFEQRSTPATFGGLVFYNCSSLASFKLSGTGNAYKLDSAGILMSGDGTRILQIPPALKLPASYTIPEGIVEISGGAFAYQTNLTSLTIPASVESIGEYAFYYCKITSLTIPASVESIGDYAFQYCTSLATLTFVDNSNLRSIGRYAFSSCKFTSFTIPSSVESIGGGAFYECTSLKTLTFENYSGVIPNSTFSKDTALTSLYSYGDIYGIYEETASSTTGQGAFYGVTKSQVAIYLPDGIIGGRTLAERQQTWKDAGFTNLKTATDKVVSFDSRGGSAVPNQKSTTAFVPTKPENPKKAGSSFRGWYSDFACTIPWDFSTSIDKSVTLYANWGPPSAIDLATGLVYTEVNDGAGLTVSVAEDGTEGCVFTQSTIKTAAIPETHDYFGQTLPVIGITEGGFTDCLALTSVTFSGTSKVTSVGKGAFSGCKALDSFPWGSIPSLTSLGDYAFRGSAIASAELPAGITSVPTSAFEGCVSLARVTFAGPVTSINASAFAQCKALTSISLPAGLSTIAGSAFAESGLTAIVIPETLTSLGEYAFSACTSLTSVTFEGNTTTPSSLKDLSNSAFDGCTALVSVSLAEGLESISESAFSGCSALGSIRLSSTVKTLDRLSFQGCTSLRTFDASGSALTSIGESAFAGCTTLKDVILPDSTQSIGKSAFADCSTLSSFVSPTSLTSIGELAFTRSGVASVTLAPQGALTINSQAFAECSSLTTAVLNPASSGTLALGDAAFIDAINMNILKVGTHASNLVIEPTALSGCLSPSINSMIICEGLATDGSIARDAFDSTTKRKVLVALNPNDADNQAAWRTAGFTNFGSATSHTLSFDLAYTGGPTPPASQTLYEGQLATKPKDPYRASYSFEGWFASDATTPWDFTTSRMGTTDITLTAKWKQGVDPDPVSVDVSIGDAIKLDAQGNATETEASFISRTDAPIYLASTTCTLAQDESNPVFANNAKGVSVTFRSPKGPEKSTGALAGSILSFGPATLPSFVLASKTSTATALVGLELTQAASVNYSPESRSVAVLTYTFARG